MRIIVAGGRVRVSKPAVYAVLSKLSEVEKWDPNNFLLIEGHQVGTDKYSGCWAKDNGFRFEPTPIDPEKDGSTEDAPKYRNYRMLYKQPDRVIVFPGGPGTRHMLSIAEEIDVPIYDVELDDGEFKVWLLPGSLAAKGTKATLIATGTYKDK